MRSRLLQRGDALETVTVEPFDTTDEQGQPSYSSSSSISARPKRGVEFLQQADGTEIRIDLTLWVPGDATTIPNRRDRLTYGVEMFVVEARETVKDLNGIVDHYKLMCRDETSG